MAGHLRPVAYDAVCSGGGDGVFSEMSMRASALLITLGVVGKGKGQKVPEAVRMGGVSRREARPRQVMHYARAPGRQGPGSRA